MKVLKFVTDSVEAKAFAEQKNVTNIWINGSETYITVDDTVTEVVIEVTEEAIPEQVAVDEITEEVTVTRRRKR